MIGKKVRVAVCMALACVMGATAQIKSYVGIVRESYFPESIEFLTSFRDGLNEEGYLSYGKEIDAYLKGGFGSGFVYVGPDGKNYVVTNRHAVSQAASASIEFEDAKGKRVKYDNLSIVRIDEDIDLALLAFPEGQAPFAKGLALSLAAVDDGQDIWSAGFPALGDEPSWQLGKGTVTNASARVPDLCDPELSTLIQHSAQIDAGNSGGPLMVSSAKDTGGYRVVGINAWKVLNRQATNFAIPSSTVLSFIKASLDPPKAASESDQIAKRAARLADDISKKDGDFTSIVKYVSYQYVSFKGEEAFKKIVGTAPSAVRETVLSVFSSYSPIEGLRYALAYDIWSKLHNDKIPEEKPTVGAVAMNEQGAYAVPLSVTISKKPIKTVWNFEHGNWLLASCLDPAKKDEINEEAVKVTSSPEIYFPHHLLLALDGELIPANPAESRFGGTMQWFFGNFGLGFSLSKGPWTFQNVWTGPYVTDTIAYTPIMGLRLPLDFSTFYLIPYVNAGPCFIIGHISSFAIDSDLSLMFQVGLYAGFHPDLPVNWLFGVSYKNYPMGSIFPPHFYDAKQCIDFSVAFVW